MKISNLKSLNTFNAVNVINKELNLSIEQKRILEEVFDSGDYQLFESVEVHSPNPLVRLTVPFYFTVCFLLFLFFMPIQWLLTGNFYLNSKTKLYKTLKNWENKLNI